MTGPVAEGVPLSGVVPAGAVLAYRGKPRTVNNLAIPMTPSWTQQMSRNTLPQCDGFHAPRSSSMRGVWRSTPLTVLRRERYQISELSRSPVSCL